VTFPPAVSSAVAYQPIHSEPWHSHLRDADMASEPYGAMWDPSSPPFQAPGAPLLKDYDSFTEGSALGSFDFSLPGTPHIPYSDLEPLSSLAFCPDDPTRSIETWRDDVRTSMVCSENRLPNKDGGVSRDTTRGTKRQRSTTPSDKGCDGLQRARCRVRNSLPEPTTYHDLTRRDDMRIQYPPSPSPSL
jgi:hypothetical protein